MTDPNLISLYVGVFAGFCFFIYSVLWCKKAPKLNQVAVVILSWTGFVVGFHLGYIAMTANASLLGILSDQRIAIVLGALAVVWTAGESFLISLQDIRLKSKAKPASEDFGSID